MAGNDPGPIDAEQDPATIQPLAPSGSAGQSTLPQPNVSTEPYNQARAHDEARKTISYFLLWTLVAVILLLAAFPLIYLLDVSASGDFDEERGGFVVQILNIVVGPLVALIGSAMGFYFGSRNKDG
ncbi:MAG: hypothetical protein SNJ63_03345 [Sphingomonadaceae bacterium]